MRLGLRFWLGPPPEICVCQGEEAATAGVPVLRGCLVWHPPLVSRTREAPESLGLCSGRLAQLTGRGACLAGLPWGSEAVMSR